MGDISMGKSIPKIAGRYAKAGSVRKFHLALKKNHLPGVRPTSFVGVYILNIIYILIYTYYIHIIHITYIYII